jgi:hypothetical protein
MCVCVHFKMKKNKFFFHSLLFLSRIQTCASQSKSQRLLLCLFPFLFLNIILVVKLSLFSKIININNCQMFVCRQDLILFSEKVVFFSPIRTNKFEQKCMKAILR